ncbi:MAG: 50S ribosomal protein L6 [Bdellovibrionota bacterium]|jgi:large subunit ribosomal protein L6
MSRIGKLPIDIPSGVKANITNGVTTIDGPRGKLEFRLGAGVEVVQEGNTLVVNRTDNTPQSVANHGTTRSMIANMVHGVTQGWKRSLELNGVGYVANCAGDKLTLKVGLSHDVVMPLPAAITCKVERNVIQLESNDRQALGNFAAKIRRVRPPEPYLGKGIKYAEETIKRKAGKTAKAK